MPSTNRPTRSGVPPTAVDVLVCNEVSVVHHDGSTACVDPDCEVPHGLHRFVAGCTDLDVPCGCVVTAEGVRIAA